MRTLGIQNQMQKSSVTIASLGTLRKTKEGQETFWFGKIRIAPTNHDIELTVRTVYDLPPDETQIALLEAFPTEYEFIMTLLLTHLKNAFSSFDPQTSVDLLRKMYFLTAIELKADTKEWWLTLEPSDVPTPYNFFPRFTVIDRTIKWSNVN